MATFPNSPGVSDIVPWYANNEIYLLELRFCVPISEWNKFLDSKLCRDLFEYSESLKTQDKNNRTRETECVNERSEIVTLKPSELPLYIAVLLMKELPEHKRNVHECEKILNRSLNIIKRVTLDSSILQ